MSEFIADVGLDLDTCLNNLEHHWLKDYNRDYGDNLKPEDLLTWDTWKYVKPECGKEIYKYLHSPGMFAKLDPKPYSQEVVQWMSQYFNLYIVTAYSWDVCADKAQWILKHYPCIPERNIMFICDKSKVCLDYLVDDGPHNVEGFKGQSILIDMAYNRYLGDKYPRVKDYQGVKEYFENVLRSKNIIL